LIIGYDSNPVHTGPKPVAVRSTIGRNLAATIREATRFQRAFIVAVPNPATTDTEPTLSATDRSADAVSTTT
jgi:hypothetical protein